MLGLTFLFIRLLLLLQVALTIVGLALELQSQHSYQGPCIQLGHQRPQPLQVRVRGVCEGPRLLPGLKKTAAWAEKTTAEG